MTPEEYHSGDGAIATCLCGPVYGGNHHAATLAEWAEFQKLMGVSKVGGGSFIGCGKLHFIVIIWECW